MKYVNQSKEIKINKCQAEMNREKKYLQIVQNRNICLAENDKLVISYKLYQYGFQ